MNRPIKFRQWLSSKWHYWGFVSPSAFASPASNELADNGFNTTSQQFTGLKDKNGKEIYEGDIVRTVWGLAQIIWEDGGFLFTGSNNENWLRQEVITERQIEVIGNIYENPELLK